MGIFNFNSKFKKILFLSVSFTLLAFFSLPHSNSTALAVENTSNVFFFTKNLKIGDVSEDVRVLQKILNSNSATEVSAYGAGSSGNETIIFGALTKKAVIKIQELYATDILWPLGLKKGTGFVGIATRLKLNSLIEAGNLATQSNSKANSFSSPSEFENQSSFSSSQSMSQNASSENNSFSSLAFSSGSSSETVFSKSLYEVPGVRVYNTSEYQIKPGALISVAGEGFAPTGNIVHIGESRSIRNIKAESSSSLPLAIPKDLSAGKYEIWIENENGTSKSETIKIYIVITDNPAERPIVEKIEPREATYDSEITVSGKGFTASGNNIYSDFGNVMNISSPDGKTIKFNAPSMLNVAKLQSDKSMKNMQAEIWFYVVNDNGYNKEPASFIIKF